MSTQAARRADDDEEIVSGRMVAVPQPFQIMESVRQQRLTDIYLSEAITDPKYYTEVIHRLRTAQPQDIISLHLSCPGGRLDTGVQIINAMKDSEARIVAVLSSKAYSLGTLIFLAADEFQIHDNCTFMIHNYSGGTAGKGNEQVAELNATVKWFKKLAKKYYIPFLSKKELKKVLNGHDMWMDSDEVKVRLKNMVRIQQEEREAAAAAEEAAKEAAESTPADKHEVAIAGGILPTAVEVAVETTPGKPRRQRRRKSDTR